MFDIQGPTLFIVNLIHDADRLPEEIMKLVDAEIEKVRSAPVDTATYQRALVTMRSD